MSELLSSSLDRAADSRSARGFVEALRDHRVVGWCVDLDAPQRPVGLDVVVGGCVIGTVRTLIGRSDLEVRVGAGTRAGFEFDVREAKPDLLRAGLLALASGTTEAVLEVRLASGGATLPAAAELATRETIESMETNLVASAERAAAQTGNGSGMGPMESAKGSQGRGGFFGRFGAAKSESGGRGIPRGCIDVFDGTTLHGWAVAGAAGAGSRSFALADGEAIVARFEACVFRQDLLDAGIGDGHHGFAVAVPAQLFDGQEHAFCIVSLGDDAPIPAVELRVTLAQGPRAHAPAAPAGIEGNVDGIFGPFLVGWATRGGEDAEPVEVTVFHRGVCVGRALANEFRDDLAAAGKGGGVCGFRVALPSSLLTGRGCELVAFAGGRPLGAALRCSPTRAPVSGRIDRLDHASIVGALRSATPGAVGPAQVQVAVWCDEVRVATLEATGPFRVELPALMMDGREHRIVLATDAPSVVLDELAATTNVVESWSPVADWFEVHAARTPVAALPPRIAALASRIASSALFSAARYAAAVEETFDTELDAAVHYLRTRSSWSLATSPWLDVEFVAAVAEPVSLGLASPLEWYFSQLASADAGPNAIFSNVDFVVLSGRSFDGERSAPSLFDEWLALARTQPVAPSALVDAAWVSRAAMGSLADALFAWLSSPPAIRKASALHAYFDDDWIGQRCLLAQRKGGACVFTSFRSGELRGIAPHAVLDRKGCDGVDLYAELRAYELTFAERGVDAFARLCPQFDPAVFRGVAASMAQGAAKRSLLATYLSGAAGASTPSFLLDVDDAFVAAQYPALLAFCKAKRGVDDVNRVAARWLRPLGLPTKLEHVTHPEPGMLGLQDLATLRSFRSAVAETPRVSFVIPSYGRDDLVLRCVLSAIQSPGAAGIEFFVAEDAAHIDCGWILGYFLPFVTVHRNATNLGFLRSCNGAVPRTRGEVVLLVNNDVIVHRDAVNELLLAFDGFPRAGVVGGLILNRDGTIQENGGMLWRDASAWNYRRNRALDAESLFNTRAADYVSGCWIAVRRAVWNEVGGFDDRFAPAYCEESDLCMTVRQRGYDVLVAPHSVVTHLDGATMGQDENGNTLKAYQRINREKLVQKWRRVLATHNENADVSPFHTGFEDGQKSVVIVFDHYVPEHDRDAGSRTIYAFLRALAAQRENYVLFVPMNNHRGKYAKSLERMGIEVISGGEGWARFDAVIEKHRTRVKHVLVSRLGVAEHFSWHLDQLTCPKSIYLHDIEALRAFPTDAADVHGDSLVERSMARYVARHRATLAKFDAVISCSREETELLKKFVTRSVVDVFPYNHEPVAVASEVATRRDILFVGSYNHPPNREAIEVFLERAWPEIRAKLPEARLHVCGSGFENASFDADPRVIVHGQVTDATLAYLYRLARVAIAPLLSGAGIKGKVIEACAHGVLPVGTAVAWQGIDLPAGHERLSGPMDSFGSRLVEAYEAFDVAAHATMVRFYEAQRRTNNIDDVLPKTVNAGRWS